MSTAPVEPTVPAAPALNEYRAVRAAKAEALRKLGIDPFGARFTPTHSVAAARALAPAAVGPEVPADQRPKGPLVTLAGRIGNLRRSGKNLIFATLFDRSRGDVYRQQQLAGVTDLEAAEHKKERGIQLFIEVKILGESFAAFDQLDLADWLGVTGHVGRTKTGEISIFVESFTVLGKAMLPPPHQAGAGETLAPETRARQRYLDLMMSDQSLSTFMTRSRLVAGIRRFFTDKGYLEVETPMLHPIPGGATARPFVTHHNALDMELYLRIAPELYLKRLIVGGVEKVFELNRNFRNEGISPRHNPEFTMIEWYQAYADHHVMMDLSEELFRHLADQILGTRILKFGQWTIDLDQPWRRISYRDALPEFGGFAYDDKEKVYAKARELGLKLDEYPTYDRLANEVWEEVVEPHLIQPTFITDQPTWLTPLCKAHPNDPSRTLRFELFMARMEVGNAYSELNDPDIQRQRLSEQAAEAKAAQDDEAGVLDGMVDHDFCTALDHGLPVCGGQGIGIDRLIMLFTGQTNIRDVILFPTMRPE
jgi:lysyl-tRNA synthetase class 2